MLQDPRPWPSSFSRAPRWWAVGCRRPAATSKSPGVAAQLWDAERLYLADPRRILQVGDTALVVAGHAINVARRTDDGSWRYAISLLDLEETKATKHR